MKITDIAITFLAIMCAFNGFRVNALKTENRDLRAKLAYWECTEQREPEQPPAPVEVGPTLIEETEP